MTRDRRRKRRMQKYDEQDGLCHYCTGDMILACIVEGQQPPALATLEHIHQKAAGGTYADHNTKAACSSCNVSRPDGMTSEAYLLLRRRLLPIWLACTQPDAPIRRMLGRYSRQTPYYAEGIAA